jgi:hypothetical protein
MATAFDIFQMESNGVLLWRGSAPTTGEALTSIAEFDKKSPGDYMIINLVTRKRFVVKSHSTEIASAASA